jgi:hypothetical protein
MLLRGAGTPVACPACHQRSFVPLNGPNAYWALGILVLGALASFPPSVVFPARAPSFLGAAVRLEIWSIALLVAAYLFAFSRPLQRADAGLPRARTLLARLWAFPSRTLFILLLGAYLYFLYRQLPHVP